MSCIYAFIRCLFTNRDKRANTNKAKLYKPKRINPKATKGKEIKATQRQSVETAARQTKSNIADPSKE